MSVDTVLRWIHILSAIVLLGGSIYTRFVLLPAITVLPEEQRRSLLDAIRAKWSKVVMIAVTLLLFGGLINFSRVIETSTLQAKYYHPVMGVKVLLALVVFFLASALAGRSALAEKLRANAKLWITLTILLGVTIVCLAGIAKSAARIPKAPPSVPEGIQESQK